MPMNIIIKEIEGQRGILQIILYLQQNGEQRYGNLYNNKPHLEISNNETAKRALLILKRHRLIKCKHRKNNALYYCLTEKGQRFAQCINDIENLLTKV